MIADRIIAWTLAFALAFFPVLVSAQSPQVRAAVLGYQQPAPVVVGSYTGPGDVVSGATAWGSCARAYNAAYANGTNPLCDLVDSSAPTTVICTLRVLTAGFVDLTGTYCTGSVTPAVKCAAATGAVCNISKVYDQSGNSNDFVQVTAANQPTLSFASINSLPAINCGTGASISVTTAGTFTTSSFSLSAVYIRSSGTAQAGVIGSSTSNGFIGSGTIANNAQIQFGSTLNVAGATDNAFHGLNGTLVTASNAALNIDGTDNTGLNAGTLGLSAVGIRFCRASTQQLLGKIAEAGSWNSTAFTPTQRTNLYNNMHGASGYNGAF